MKTIIFGGSFDPIHNGHILIAKKAMEELDANRVVFMLARSPRWKETTANSDDRLNMLQLAIKDEPRFEISLLEYNSKDEINYTYNTICKFPRVENEKLYFLLGFDQLEKLDKWFEIDKLKDLVQLVSISRPGYEAKEANITKYKVKLIDIPLSNMSSSKLREMSCLDAPKVVLDYIVDHELYYIPKLKSLMKEKRYLHTISVANLCYMISSKNGINKENCYLAGLLHDIGKDIDINYQREYLETIQKDLSKEIPEPLYHQYTSEKLAREIFHVNDEQILDAIKYHGTGKENMSKMAMILYSSDKIDPLRGYDSSILIKLCQEDIKNGFIEVLRENIKYFNIKHISYQNKLTLSCIDYYLGKENK